MLRIFHKLKSASLEVAKKKGSSAYH